MPTADMEIYLYDIAVGGAPVNISNNQFGDYDPQISTFHPDPTDLSVTSSRVVWYGSDGSDLEVFLYDAATGMQSQLTNDLYHDLGVQIDGENVVWESWESQNGNVDEIVLYQIDPLTGVGVTKQLTNDSLGQADPQVSGDNVVWQSTTGANTEIFYVNVGGGSITPQNISNNSFLDGHPRVAGNQVVWLAGDEANNDWEVYYYELDSLGIPVNMSQNDYRDWKPLVTEEMVVWRVNDGQDYEIAVATRIEPTVPVTITLEINGDTIPEDDEFFFLNILGATVEGINSFDIMDHVAPHQATVEIYNDDGDLGLDYGDAPASYSTLLADNGARHQIKGDLYLGASQMPDADGDGQPGPLALGDDAANLADEDGVVFNTPLVPGKDTSTTVTATGDGYLDAWMDFNGDGDWDDAGEQIFASEQLNDGDTPLTFAVPDGAVSGDTFARFRFSSTGGLSYTGSAIDGEVEDHRVPVQPKVQGNVVNVDGVVTVYGTEGDDLFKFYAGSVYTIVINGETHYIPHKEVDEVRFDGGAGKDRAVFQGTAGVERAFFHLGEGFSSTFGGTGYLVTVTGVESLNAYGNGGRDVSRLYDDATMKDTFNVNLSQSKLSNDESSARVVGYPVVQAYSSGGNDVGIFYDDPAIKEVFHATPKMGVLYSDQATMKAYGFSALTAYSRGGNDVATLFDDPDADDKFIAAPRYGKLISADVVNCANDFRYVYAYSTGGEDQAQFYDDRYAVDSFVGKPEFGRMSGENYLNRADGFGHVHAFSRGGKDVANLYDSSGNDTFVSSPLQGKLTGKGFYHRAVTFPTLNVYSTKGGDDKAILFDSVLASSPDHLEAGDDWVSISNEDLGYAYWMFEFEDVDARVSNSEDTQEIDADALDFLLLNEDL